MPIEIMSQKTDDIKPTELFMIRGVRVEGIRSGDDVIISRIISTDPKQYLDPFLSPGNKIKIR